MPTAQVRLVRLPRVQADIPRAHDKRPPQHVGQLALVKEVQHAHAHAVEVHALVAEGHGTGVGAQGGEDGLGEAVGEVEGEGRLGVVVVVAAGRGEGEHLGKPEGEGEGRAGLEAVGGVVEVAEVWHVDFECAGDFLYGRMKSVSGLRLVLNVGRRWGMVGDIPPRPLGLR